MNLQSFLDWFWMSRRRACVLGFTHEGTHFGVPIWCVYHEDTGDIADVVAKVGAMEFLITLGCMSIQFTNSFRQPGDELLFPFKIRRLKIEALA